MSIDLVIETEHLPPQFRWDPTRPERGTEKFYVETAKAAAKMGQNVVVLGDFDSEVIVDRVKYVPCGPETTSMLNRLGIRHCLVCNPRQRPYHGRVKAARVDAWTNFNLPAEQYGPYLREVDHIIDSGLEPGQFTVISEYHRQQILKADPSPPIPIRVVPHGVDRSIYYPGNDTLRKKQIVYSSSPDRGLALLQDIDLQGYKLVCTSYGQKRMTDQGVASLLRESQFWIHPGQGTELFCLAAVEAQACGATPIVVPNGALQETVRYGYCFPESCFIAGLQSVLAGEACMTKVTAGHIPSWEEATRQLLL